MTSAHIKILILASVLVGGALLAQAQEPEQAQAQAQAQEPRLALWIGAPLGADGAGCVNAEVPPAGAAPFLTERDVLAWDAAHARWRLDKARFAGNRTLFAMTDRCFVLMLDGKPVRGAAVASYSARWLRLPTLAVAVEKEGEISLRLSSMFNGANSPPLASCKRGKKEHTNDYLSRQVRYPAGCCRLPRQRRRRGQPV